MQAVVSEVLFQHALVVDQGREIIQIHDVVLCTVILEPAVEGKNSGLRTLRKEVFGSLGVVVHGQDGRVDDLDIVPFRQFGERSEVRLDVLVSHGAGVAGNVVCASENDDDFGLEIDHILTVANQHLGSRLSANAAINVRLRRKEILQLPVVGNGIAEEYDTILSRFGCAQRPIGILIASELSEVVGEHGYARGAVLIESGESGGGNGGRSLRRLLRKGADRKNQKRDGKQGK